MSSLTFTENGVDYPLYDWQHKALTKWNENDKKGIIAAVTGSGKTRVAHAVMSQWFADNPKGSVSIIVPKIPLLDQWKDELSEIFTDRNVGRMGGGHKEWYGTINVLVIDTAVKVLGGRQGGLGTAHLVIVDECHSLGAETYREALTCLNHATLGLSATPEREDTGLEVIAPLLGDIIFRYTYREAIRDGVIPPFTLKAVKVSLQPKERLLYDSLQFKIRNYSKNLSMKYGGGGGNLIARCQYLLKKGTQDPDIGGFLTAVREQKELVNSAKNRFSALDILLHRHVSVGEQQTMLFHESVPEIQSIAIKYAHLKPLEYHYKVTSSKKKRQAILESFKEGKSKLLLSCRALSEGFNPPKAEIGIMLSGTRSVRSRIQTLGRLLRGEDATVYFVYVADTKDTRSLSNLLNKGDIPDENVEYWEYSKEEGKIIPVADAKVIMEELSAEFQKQKAWSKKELFGESEPLICEHCCRGMEGTNSRPFRTKNGQESHKLGCRDAQRGVYRCHDCRKAFVSAEKREEHRSKCKGIERMTWDDFMAGFDKVY